MTSPLGTVSKYLQVLPSTMEVHEGDTLATLLAGYMSGTFLAFHVYSHALSRQLEEAASLIISLPSTGRQVKARNLSVTGQDWNRNPDSRSEQNPWGQLKCFKKCDHIFNVIDVLPFSGHNFLFF